MENNKKIRFEDLESIDTTMSLDKLIQAMDAQNEIVGVVNLWNSEKKEFEVDLGNGFIGHLPVCSSTVYPFFTEGEILTPSLRMIIGKPIIVHVRYIEMINEEVLITLSRKEIMDEAFSMLSMSVGETVECYVKSFSSFGVFVDVGYGISGLIHYKDLCLPRIYNYTELGFDIGDKITAKIISIDKVKSHISLSYKEQFENLAFKLNRNDLIQAVVLDPINQNGFFAYLNPNTPAVIDFPSSAICNYGDKVIAKVKGCRTNHPEDLKLTFVSFIE